jgi:hypothetical protein
MPVTIATETTTLNVSKMFACDKVFLFTRFLKLTQLA